MTRLAIAAAGILALTGCFELECDDSTASSVTVSVWTAQSEPAETDYATYSVDGSQEADCEPLDDAGHEYVCGWEETGWFVIRVHVGSDVYTEELEVELRSDGCHVDSRFVDVYLDG